MNKIKFKLNRNGFTLIEVLVCIGILSLIVITFMTFVGNTFSITSGKAYESFKKGIITQVDNYIYECDNNLIDCNDDYVWNDIDNQKETSFYLNVMKKYSYFTEDDYINPITNNDISNCLIVKVIKNVNSSYEVMLDDSKCNS